MTFLFFASISLGIAIGALAGYIRKTSTGPPLSPFRGAVYGGITAALFAMLLSGAVRDRTAASTATGESMNMTANKLLHVSSRMEFERIVLQARKPCLADFYSDGCPPCRMLGPILERLAAKYTDQVIICKVSMDAAPELAQPYGIRAIPAVLFFNNGKEVNRLVGLRPERNYAAILDRLLADREHGQELDIQ